MNLTKQVLADVEQERIYQMSKYPDYLLLIQDFVVMSEEVGEVAQALQSEESWSKETDKSDLYHELIQVAAVAVKMAEKIKRNEENEYEFNN